MKMISRRFNPFENAANRYVGNIASALRHPCFWMVLAAFVLRFGTILIDHTYEFRGTFHFAPWMHHFNFGFETGSIARSVAEGHGFSSPFTGDTGPSAWIGPLYVYLCAAVFKVFGVFTTTSAIVILGLNSAFSAVNSGLIYVLGNKLFNKRTGLFAGWAWAVLPQFMTWCTTWVWETALSGLLITLAVLFAIELSEKPASKKWIWFGVFWGANLLVNPALLTLLPVSLAWIAFRLHRAAVPYLKHTFIAMLVCFATISPWLIRNRVAFGQWVFIRSNFAFELYLDNHEIPTGESYFSPHPTINPVEYDRYRTMGELAFVKFYGEKAKLYIRQHPDIFLRRTASRIGAFWSNNVWNYLVVLTSPPSDLLKKAVFMLLTFAGLVVAATNRIKHWQLCAAVMFLYPIPYYITFPSDRYRHPVEPILLIFATYFPLRVLGIAREAFIELRQLRFRKMDGIPCEAEIDATD